MTPARIKGTVQIKHSYKTWATWSLYEDRGDEGQLTICQKSRNTNLSVHSRAMNNIHSKGQMRENCVFHFLSQHDILDWVAEKADEFAGPPDEPELSLE